MIVPVLGSEPSPLFEFREPSDMASERYVRNNGIVDPQPRSADIDHA